jgi:hypothetical protein
VAAAGAAVLVVLLLSDRAPGATEAMLRRVRRVGRIFERRTGFDLFDVADLPFDWEQAGHMTLWAAAAAVVYLLLTGGRGGQDTGGRVVASALTAFALSVGFELAQFLFTSTRRFEFGDLASNAVGVLCGAIAAAIVDSVHRRITARQTAARNLTG